MTTIFTEATIATILEATYARLSGTFGIALIALLLALLIGKEVARSLSGPRAQALMRVLDIAIAPLLAAFGFVIAMRLIDLLRFA